MAEDIITGIYIQVGFDSDTGLVSVSGEMPSATRTRWLTYYMLNPGYDYTAIPTETEDEQVVANYGQIVTEYDGSFEIPSFKYEGAAGICKLYITTGGTTVVKEIDTSVSTAEEKYMLTELYALPKTFGAPQASTVKDIFFEMVDELPDEMPIISPAEVSGLTVVYVDVKNGSDTSGDGSIDNPYKTVRYSTNKHKEKGTVLCLREGTYPMSDNLELLANVEATEKLPYFITNYPGEEVVVSGGVDIGGNMFESLTDPEILQRLDPAVTDNILVADLSSLIPDGNYGSITTSNAPVLFVGDSKYQIARWPNAEMTTMKKCATDIADTNDGTANKMTDPAGDYVATNGVIDSGPVTTSIGSSCGEYREYSRRITERIAAGLDYDATVDNGIEFCVEDLRPFSWVDTGDIWMYGSFYTEWTKNHLKITEFNAETESIRTATGLGWGSRWNSGNKFYYYNVLEELDAPGEWFLDKEAGKLYIYPVGDISDEDIVYAPKSDTMWRLYNTENVIINGIKFRNARGEALEIQYGTNNVIQNCTFENLGSGVEVAGAAYSGVINSEFKNINGKAITLDGKRSTTSMTPTRQFAQNNKLHSTKGISVGSSVGNIVSHNFVSNNIGSAINASSSKETVLEYNEIVGGPREVLDSGAFYINGNNHFHRATHVRYNYIHDIGSTDPRSIYFDDMLSGCYAYGNVLEGGYMQIHNGSENVVYNNLFLGHSSSISNSPNYYGTTETTGWPERWYATSLNMGTMASGLKALYKAGTDIENIADGDYAEIFARYPHLYEWSKLMLKRIYEYQGKDQTEYTGKIAGSAYLSSYKPSDEFTDGSDDYYNIDRYLRASRDIYIANNIFANTATPKFNQYETIEENTANGTRDTKAGGIIRTTYENNHQLSASPFTDKNYDDSSVTSSYGIEAIPFDKMGICDTVDKFQNGKAKPISPADTTDSTVLKDDLALQWTPVVGAQLYKVEVASDEAFTDVFESKELRDMVYTIKTDLSSDTVYYWRVTTTPQGKGAEGEVVVSDVFKFKTSSESTAASEHNAFGITDYKMTNDDGEVLETIPESGVFNVDAYAYNLTDAEKSAIIYVACYDEDGRFISAKQHGVTVAPNMLSSEFSFKINAPGAALIKMFVWSADGNMIPYTFVKTLE